MLKRVSFQLAEIHCASHMADPTLPNIIVTRNNIEYNSVPLFWLILADFENQPRSAKVRLGQYLNGRSSGNEGAGARLNFELD